MRKLDHGPAAPKIARPSIHPNPSSRFRRTSIAPPTDDSQITQHRIPTLKSGQTASIEDWHRSFDMVALPALELTRAVIDGMASRKHGRIVNITSITVRLPIPSLAVSASARAAATAVMNALAREVADSGVTINNILPGPFETDELARLFKIRAEREGKSVEEIRAKRLQEVPVGRFGRVEEVGALCAFLCSRHAGYITGRDLLIDGGVFPTSP